MSVWSRLANRGETGQLPHPEIFRNIVKTSISFLFVKYNKVNYFFPIPENVRWLLFVVCDKLRKKVKST